LLEGMNSFLTPIRERYEQLMKNPDTVRDALHEGARKARLVANQTMEKVHELVGGL